MEHTCKIKSGINIDYNIAIEITLSVHLKFFFVSALQWLIESLLRVFTVVFLAHLVYRQFSTSSKTDKI